MPFNPNQPRDEDGKWTDGGGTSWTALGNGRFMADKMPMVEVAQQDKHFNEYEHLRTLAAEIGEHASKLGFDPMMVTVTNREHPFEVNGQNMHAAGTAHRDDGRITIYANQVPHGAHWTPGLMAHEIMHQKFNAFMRDYQAEYARLQQDPDYHKDTRWVNYDPNNPVHAAMNKNGDMLTTDGQIREKGFMNPNGSLNEPFASKYPLYQTYNRVMVGTDEFRKSDGVSEYSKNWWTDVVNGKAGWDVGIHETLAEMAKIKLNMATDLREHKERVKDILKRGGKWDADDEKLWKANSNNGYRHYREGEVDGKKVYFATTKGSPQRVARVWSELYDAVNDHWKRKWK